jgi:hypothetical protein
MTFPIRAMAFAALTTLVVAGCATKPDVRGDFDKSADFGKYRTYNFMSKSGTDASDAKSLVTSILQSAAAREMEARGYTKSETPDLVINFKGKLEEKTDIESTPAPYYGPSYGYRGWYGAPYGGYGGTEVTTRRYNVGTLVMDVVDHEKRQVVFQGGYQTTVSKEMMENREASLNAAVASMFAKYPFRAGESAPVPLPDAK